MSKSVVQAKKSGVRGAEPQENTYEWEFAKPLEDYSTKDKIKRAFYNPDEGTYLGRTPIMWVKLMVFYTIFYILLAILFAICMYGLMLSINKDRPTYVLDSSLIGTNPGLGFRPMPDNFEEGNSVIWAIPSNKTNTQGWVKLIDNYLSVYKQPPKKKGARQMCDYDSPPVDGKVCTVDVDSQDWGTCTSAHNYGFATSSPCVFIKLNKIFGWVPEYYNNSNELPNEMPDDLKSYIRKVKDKKMYNVRFAQFDYVIEYENGQGYIVAKISVRLELLSIKDVHTGGRLNTVWLSCHGDSPSDKEYIGSIEMYPTRGFPGYYYPYTNQVGYLSPLVAVHFKRPAMNTLISIECRIWAKNAEYNKHAQDRQGSVHFELMLD